MKACKIIYGGIALAVLSSCIQEIKPEGQHISGTWAIVNEQSQTKEYIQFKDGYMYDFLAEEYLTAMEGHIWHCSQTDFINQKAHKYSLDFDGTLYLDGKQSGSAVINGNNMQFGAKKAVAFDEFSQEYYSSISSNIEKNTIQADFLAQNLNFEYSVTNTIPNSAVSAKVNPQSAATVTFDGEGKMVVVLAETNKSATSTITLSYPGAADVVVSLERKPASYIDVSKTDWSYDYKAQQVSIPVSLVSPAEGASISAALSQGASWLKDLTVNESEISFSLEESNSPSTPTRTAEITLSAKGTENVVLKVAQAYSAPEITFTPASLSTDYTTKKNQTFTYSVSNPREGGTTSVTCSSSWISNLKDNNGTVTYDIAENNAGASRSASISVNYTYEYTYGGISRTKLFKVTQTYSSVVIAFTPASQTTDYTAKSLSFTYSITNPREGVTSSAATTDAWITDVKLSGNTVSYKVAENNSGAQRAGKITLTYGTLKKEFSVTQSYSAISIAFTPISQSTDYAAKSLSFTYSITNPREGVTASAATTDAWITDVKLSGNTVNYKVAENNSGAQRAGKITLTYGTLKKEFSVTQSYTASVITCDPTSQSTDYTAKNLSFTYSITNPREGVTASASTTDSWITNVQVSGTTVSYKVAENNSGASRTGKIKLTYGSVTKDFSVTQSYTAPVISFTPSSQSTDYTAKSLSFTYSITNPREGVTASAATTDAWITDVKLSGNTVGYKVAENNSGAQRAGKITLTYGTLKKEFSVTQSYTAPVISFTPSSQTTDYTAKSLSFSFSIDTPRDGASASASTADTWITDVNLSGNTVSYKVTENNNGASRTGKIKLTYSGVTKDFSVTQSPSPLVDLGLSVKWATSNLGAFKPEDYGGYYQWAGTTDVTDKSINLYWSNCPYHTGSSNSSGWTKYIPSGKSSYWSGSGSPDNKTVLDPEDDVAHVKLGGKWRMPTKAEWDELRNSNNCSWSWTSQNGVRGYKVTSKKSGYTSKSIFLPAAGCRSRGSLDYDDSSGYYWSSSLSAGGPDIAYYLNFNSGNVYTFSYSRFYGQSVRPVSE